MLTPLCGQLFWPWNKEIEVCANANVNEQMGHVGSLKPAANFCSLL